MEYTLSRIIEQVRIALDENEVTTDILASDIDTLQLDDIIRQKIGTAIRLVLLQAPIGMVDTGKPITSALEKVKNLYKLKEPEDFLRILTIRMSDWDIALHTLVSDDSEEYMACKSDFAGIRPNRHRPLAVEVATSDGKEIELYGSGDDATMLVATYIANPTFDSGDDEGGTDDTTTIDLPSKLYTSILYIAAGLTAQALSDENHAQALMAIGQGIIQGSIAHDTASN